MERLIAPHHPIHDLLRRRWSPRAFDQTRTVGPETLAAVFEAARWTPSSNNEQPWAFVVARRERPDEFGRVLACLAEKNQSWAKDAPVLMIAAAAKTFSRNGAPNRHSFYDLGQAVAMMTVQATALGLYVHQMAGFSPGAARQALAVPETHEPVTAIALGYLGDPHGLPEDLRQRELTPTTRKPIADFVSEGKWGQPPEWARPRG